jgi:hypothetical protein
MADPELAYDLIRASVTDVARIAANTGFKIRQIEAVKRHLFINVHLLDRYVSLGVPPEKRRFDADRRISDAWVRLEHGTQTGDDLALLRQEVAELWYMRRHGPSYSAAHLAAQARFPSPYT